MPIELHLSGSSVFVSDNTLVAGASGVVGAPPVVQQTTAADVHPHDWHEPESAWLDGTVLVLTAGVVLGINWTRGHVQVREHFSFHRGLSP
jgi:hypothetical protein